MQRIRRHRWQRLHRQRRTHRQVLQLRGNIGSRLPPTLQKTFGNQLSIGTFHRRARHAQIARQSTNRRQPTARLQSSLRNGIFNSQINLPVQRVGKPTVQR
ncbi:hypothetical protein D3C80_1170210 [compost metagenome]